MHAQGAHVPSEKEKNRLNTEREKRQEKRRQEIKRKEEEAAEAKKRREEGRHAAHAFAQGACHPLGCGTLWEAEQRVLVHSVTCLKLH